MNARWLDIQNPTGAGDRHSASLLGEHRHRESLVQDTKLAAFALLVIGVTKDATIKKGTVDVGNHGSKRQGC